ncbi:MAG: hypothetical protein HeimC2_08560 [Candidatus Heimdallarchaeota archaeon LC_2]|nr:MAG: hypothetical protein HeimC2_08560 [Candidatus Heimdallarchaeota archaeon LC_2]
MTDTRLFAWFTVSLGFLILFPIIRKVLNPKNSTILDELIKSLIFTELSSIFVVYLYLSESIKSPEFLFLLILIAFIYFYSGFNKTLYSWSTPKSKISTFNHGILKRIGRSFGGSKVESTEYGYTFTAVTPYRLKYRIDAVSYQKDNSSNFIITSETHNFTIIKVINLIALYLMTQSLISNEEEVNFPLFNIETNAVLVVLFSISLTLIILYIEIDIAKNMVNTLPTIYAKLLQNEALSKLPGSGTSLADRKDDVKGRAQAILDRRNSNVLRAKKEEVEGKLSSVFGEKETVPLDKKSIVRMRLMETIKRILNSTPPWSKVSLKEIAELGKGKEEEVEIIIAGLIDLKEVKGIYDIWNKTYHGTSSSHWLITKILNELPDTDTSLENVKIHPDGAGEFSFNKKEK